MSVTHRSQGAKSPVERAALAWRECALHVRGQLRARSVHGQLRRLDDIARGARGSSVANGIALLVANLHAEGMTPDEIAIALQAGLLHVIHAAIPDKTA